MNKPILVVEDVPQCLTGLCRKLEKAKIPYTTVADRESAESFLKKQACGLVFVDVWLQAEALTDPHTSGLQLLQNLRAGVLGEENREIPAIVFTGYPELDIEDRVADLGGAVMFAKPHPTGALFELIEVMLATQK